MNRKHVKTTVLGAILLALAAGRAPAAGPKRVIDGLVYPKLNPIKQPVVLRETLPNRIKLLLETKAMTVPLDATVIWVRKQPTEGSPSGMGVELHEPPALFVHFVGQQRKRRRISEEEPEFSTR